MSGNDAQAAEKDVKTEKQPKQRLNSYSAAASKPATTPPVATESTNSEKSNPKEKSLSRSGSKKSTSENNKKVRDTLILYIYIFFITEWWP